MKSKQKKTRSVVKGNAPCHRLWGPTTIRAVIGIRINLNLENLERRSMIRPNQGNGLVNCVLIAMEVKKETVSCIQSAN